MSIVKLVEPSGVPSPPPRFQSFLQGLESVSGPDSGGWWAARCPSHADNTPSLSLTPGDVLPAVVKCHAGCDPRDIYAALGVPYYRANRSESSSSGEDRRHCYLDPMTGQHLGATVKKGGQWHREPSGVALPLYRAWDARECTEVWLVEGERDADSMWEIGQAAVSAPSNRLSDQHLQWMSGRRVRLVADPDEAGLKHLRHWHLALVGAGIEVVGAWQPPSGWDLTDLLGGMFVDGVHYEGDLGDLRPVATESLVAPDPDLQAAIRVERLRSEARRVVATEKEETEVRRLALNLQTRSLGFSQLLEMSSQPWTVEGLLPVGATAMLVGAEASLKSFIAFDWACRIASGGGDWFGRRIEGGAALYLAAEGSGGYGQRSRAWAIANQGLVPAALSLYPHAAPLSTPAAGRALLGWADQIAERTGRPLRLLVVDTLNRVSGSKDENSVEISQILDVAASIRENHPTATVLVLHHLSKAGLVRGSTALTGDSDTVLIANRDKPALAVTLRVDKQKDGQDGVQTEVGLDVVDLGDGTSSLAVTRASAATSAQSLTARQLTALKYVRDVCRGGGGPVRGADVPISDRGDRQHALLDLEAAGYIQRAEPPEGVKGNAVWWVPVSSEEESP